MAHSKIIGSKIRDLPVLPIEMDHVIAVIDPAKLVRGPDMVTDIAGMGRAAEIILP